MAQTNIVLPRFVTFMSDNERYITHRNAEDLNIDGQEFDRSRGAVHEIFHEGGDIVSIRSLQNQRFWRHHASEWTSNQIQASGQNRPTANDVDGRFRVVLFQNPDVALLSIGSQRYCRRFTRLGTHKLRAIDGSPSDVFGRFVVGEPSTSRQVQDVVYDLNNVSISASRPLLLASVEKFNDTSNLLTDLELTLSFEVSTTSTWSDSVTIARSVSVSVSAGVPLIGAEMGIEVSASTSRTTEWGGAVTTTNTVSNTVIVRDVPPGGAVTVSALADEANATVPFSYVLRDTWASGHVQSDTRSDGVFHGVNSFNTRYVARDSRSGTPYSVISREVDGATAA